MSLVQILAWIIFLFSRINFNSHDLFTNWNSCVKLMKYNVLLIFLCFTFMLKYSNGHIEILCFILFGMTFISSHRTLQIHKNSKNNDFLKKYINTDMKRIYTIIQYGVKNKPVSGIEPVSIAFHAFTLPTKLPWPKS